MKSVSVFCGSNPGVDSVFEKEAYNLGKAIAQNGLRLIYGGTSIGLMGRVADGVIENGGKVTGILPGFLAEKEIAHPGLDQLIFVESLHERKLKMSKLSDGSIAMAGGFGTMDEFFEIVTWRQLNIYNKPVALYNAGLFFDPLLAFIDHMREQGFVKEEFRNLIITDNHPLQLILKMKEAASMAAAGPMIDFSGN
jgi:uncharacterized protein (TIGR00730 family)